VDKDKEKNEEYNKILEQVLSVICVEVMVSSVALCRPIGAACALDRIGGGVARQAEIPLICAARMNVRYLQRADCTTYSKRCLLLIRNR
jgi:hypothetical protein